MADHDDLRRTIASLRRDVRMRPEWRRAVLRDIEALTPAVARTAAPAARRDVRRGWTLRPSTAIAAGMLCAVIGGALTFGVVRLADRRVAARSAPGERQEAPHVGAAVRFALVAPAASSVAIVGDFNGWNPTATPMRRTAAGVWSIDLPLSPGRHAYAFMVDGVLVADPDALDSADDDFGVPSSVVLVSDHQRT